MEANQLLRSIKIDNQLTGESHRDDFRKVHFSKERSNNRIFTVAQNIRIGVQLVSQKGTLELTGKKKQPDTTIVELAEGDEKV